MTVAHHLPETRFDFHERWRADWERAVQTANDSRHDSEDRRVSYAIRTIVPTRAFRLHVLPTNYCHACAAPDDRGNHRGSCLPEPL